MSGMYVGGLISGANTEDLIRKIMQLEEQRLKTQELQKSKLELKQKAWRDVRSSLSALQSKLNTLRYPFAYRARKVTLTDESVASITASSGAALTTYALSVTSMAQTHVVSHTDATARSSANDQMGVSGRFEIGLGTDLKEIEVLSTDTLNSLADKINGANTGVRADVVKVSISGTDMYRLTLTSSKSGTANSVVMNDIAGYEGTLQNLGFKDATNAWTKELSVAKDADFTLNGVQYIRSTNVIDDAVPGLSITLKKQGADATTQATVSLDADAVLESVKGWIDAVNSTQSLLKGLADYNADTNEAGILNGESTIRNLQRTIRSAISNVVTGLPSGWNRMSDVGITTGAYGTDDYGKVIIDEAKFKEMLEKDAEGVARLFGAMRNNVALSSNNATVALDGATTTMAGYDLNDVINGVTDGDRFGSTGGGWMSGAAPSVASPQGFTISFDGEKTIDQITLYQPSPDATPASTHGLKNFTLEYWDSATSTWKVLETVENFTGGTSVVYDFDPVTTSQVRLSVTETYNNHEVRITEFQVGEYNNGAAIDMYRYVRSTLETETGAIDTRDSTLTKQIDQIRDRIDRIEEQLLHREEQLRQQFARMEQAMARLRSQGAALAMQMSGMAMM